MKYIQDYKALKKYLENADYTDIKVFEGRTTLRKFIAGMLSYYPWWIIWLYRIRTIIVKILGLVEHEAPEILPDLNAGDISFSPGESVSFFVVKEAEEDRHWISETPDDKHLKAYFSVIVKPLDGGKTRFYVITTIFYKHWTGPVYFNIIRPFHHLVVSQMARAGLKK
jgi:hypothetical protein